MQVMHNLEDAVSSFAGLVKRHGPRSDLLQMKRREQVRNLRPEYTRQVQWKQ